MRLAYFWGLSSLFVFGALAYGCSAGSSSGAGAGGGAFGGSGAIDGSTGGSAGASASGGAGGTGAGGTGGAAGGGTGGTGGCTANGDCSAPTPVCDVGNSFCVECLPTDDPCPTGQYCTSGNVCSSGCSDETDCSGATAKCDTATNTCVECLLDPDCPGGEICVQNACAQGCSATQPCVNSAETCCSGSCHNLQNDTNFCGTCTTVCPTPPNAAVVCNAGSCGMGTCAVGFADCNKSALDGCEINVSVTQCVCTPSATQSCYTGPPNTAGKGLCKAGTQTCDASGLSYGPCVGQIVPSAEVCANGIDEDCTGVADDVSDTDGDGWTKCNGDCCETTSQCSAPTLVNPGAFEFAGNNVDDDCDGTTDNALQGCDNGLASNSSVALDYAKAMDLCQTTTENPALNQKKWGVISPSPSTAFALASGAGSPNANSRSIRQGYGYGVFPLGGARLAVLSSGYAAAQAAPNNVSPNWVAFQGGQNMLTTSSVPGDWLAANGNNFPNAPGCPEPAGGTIANDPIMLRLRVRVPTNAKSFSVSTFFYSSEFPEWVCSPYNDFFLALLDSAFVPGPSELPNPFDKNLAFYDPPPAGAPYYPVGVNLAFGNTGLFTVCRNGPTGCGGLGTIPGSIFTCLGETELAGTGFDIQNPPSSAPGLFPGWCGASNLAGGGTGWLTTSGNVSPGETIELRFVIWDTGDYLYDSIVLLDNFKWSVTASQPGTSG